MSCFFLSKILDTEYIQISFVFNSVYIHAQSIIVGAVLGNDSYHFVQADEAGVRASDLGWKEDQRSDPQTPHELWRPTYSSLAKMGFPEQAFCQTSQLDEL